jgi:hypothetical protein
MKPSREGRLIGVIHLRKRIINNQFFFVVAASLFIFIVYLFSLCPTLYLIDSGELATVSYTLGVAHPTGYPLYTLISFFFSRLPGSPIFNLNLLSAIFSAAAAAVLLFGRLGDQRSAAESFTDKIARSIPVFIFAFAPTIWRTSVTNEVYPLTILFCALILSLAFRLRTDRDLYLLAYVIGLSFTNHMIVFSLALPVIGYVIIVHRPGLKKIAFSAGLFLLGLTMYLYLLSRTCGGAEVAWGDTSDLQRLFWHITGKQYRVWMFSSNLAEMSRNLAAGLGIFGRNLLYVFIVPVLFGFYALYKQSRGKFILFLAIMLLNVLYTMNYSIPDIEPYYIPGWVALLFLAGYGLVSFRRYLKWYVCLPILLLIPFINYRTCTLRGNTFGRDYGQVHIEQLPARSLLISTYWDVYSPIIYLRHVEGSRKDLVVVDKELLRRTWYVKYLRREYPDLMARMKVVVDDYLAELVKFEYGRPYDPFTIQKAYIDLLKGFFEAKMDDGVFLAMPYPDRDLAQARAEYVRLPFGPDFWVVKDSSLVPAYDFRRLTIRKPAVLNDERLAHNAEFLKTMIRYNLRYYQAINDRGTAAAVEEWLKNF